MRFLERITQRVRPAFEEGGKLARWAPLYEALDTFLFTPSTVTRGLTHIRDSMDLKRMMSVVIVALLPCIYMALYNTGYQANLAMQAMGVESIDNWRGAVMEISGVGYSPSSVVSNLLHGGLYFVPVYIVCMVVGGAWEILFAIIRKHQVNEGLLVTGMLLPLTLTPTIPLWQVALGTSFGVVIAKELFGGTGKNFLNPALAGRAFLYFAYPAENSGDRIWTAVDGFSGATPLGAMATADVQTGMKTLASIQVPWGSVSVTWWDAFLGWIQGSMGETSTLACLIGAAILIATGVGSWRIMAGVLAGGMGLSLLLWSIGSETNPMFAMPPWWHLVVGGYAFGLVYMATDPVSAAMTETGQWIYGVLIGAMTILIRVINPAYPEGIMLAILFGNVVAPLIDHFVVQANIRRRLARNET
jgi:Na+-transporting NADH:ubiquinone oxidoreductase subunit B